MENTLNKARRRIRSELIYLELTMRECYLDMQALLPDKNVLKDDYINACLKRAKLLEEEINKQIDTIEREYYKEKSVNE